MTTTLQDQTLCLQYDDHAQQARLRAVERPVCPDDGVLLALEACGFCGSDLDKIRKQQASGILGHELVGRVIAMGPLAQAPFELKLNQRLAVAHHVPCGACHYCLHAAPSMCAQFKASNISPGGFSTVIAISGLHLAHTAFLLKENTSAAAATVIEPLACCLRAVERLGRGKPLHTNTTTTMAMVGLGFIGLLSSWAAQQQGYAVYGLDLKPERASLANTLGWLAQATSSPEALLSETQAATDGRGVDVVYLTVVNEATVQQALALVRNGGTIMVFAGSPQTSAAVPADVIYHRELTVLSSYSPSLEMLRQANEAIQSGAIDVTALVQDEVALSALPEAIAQYAAGDRLKLIVRPY